MPTENQTAIWSSDLNRVQRVMDLYNEHWRRMQQINDQATRNAAVALLQLAEALRDVTGEEQPVPPNPYER